MKEKIKQQSMFTPSEFREEFVKNPRAKVNKKEERLQLQICEYLKNTYPGIIWFCDLASGLKLPIWLGVLHSKMRSGRGIPDLFIACENKIATPGNFFYSGLFIELKSDSAAATTLKDGTISKNKHTQEQHAVHEVLRKHGYAVFFAHGYEEAKGIIDTYLG